MTLLIILYELFCSNPIRANVLELKTLLAVSVGPQLRKICTIIFQLSFAVGRHPYFCNRPIGVYHTSSLLTLRLPMLSLSRAALFCAAGYLCLPDYSHFFWLRDDPNEDFIPQNLSSASQSGGICVIKTTIVWCPMHI